MQSSYRNIVKGDSIAPQGTRTIITEFNKETSNEIEKEAKFADKHILDSYENIGRSILEDANRKKENIISEAVEKSSQIAKNAYEEAYKKGYEKGRNEGYNTAYEEGYQKNVDKAQKEAEQIKKNADNILNNVVCQKEKYIKDKEAEIKELILKAVESILKQEVKNKESLNNVVFQLLQQMKNTKTFVIKGRSKYCQELEKQINIWKHQLPFKGDIFIVPDDSMEEGSIVLERDNGKTVFSIDIASQKLKEMLQSQE